MLAFCRVLVSSGENRVLVIEALHSLYIERGMVPLFCLSPGVRVSELGFSTIERALMLVGWYKGAGRERRCLCSNDAHVRKSHVWVVLSQGGRIRI